MSAITISDETIRNEGPRPARGFVHDTWIIARRGLVHMKRQPEALADATIQPIMFVLLFAYVFGGAIAVPGGVETAGPGDRLRGDRLLVLAHGERGADGHDEHDPDDRVGHRVGDRPGVAGHGRGVGVAELDAEGV